MPTRHRPHPFAALLGSFAAALFASSAAAASWAWFAEPFTVHVRTTHPEAGVMEGRIVVAEDAVRTEWHVAGMVQVTIARPEGDAVRVWAGLPDGNFASLVLTGADAHELLVHGYVAAVTAPEDPRHPCTANPTTHRCTLQAEETIDGRALERWRIEADGRDGGTHGQVVWFDRAATVVVRALDDTGAELEFSDHARGPVDPALFEVP